MPSDVGGKPKLTAWRALYVTCCVLGPICVLGAFVTWTLAIWTWSGKFGATGGLLIGMALAAWAVGAIADFEFGAGKELAKLKKQVAEQGWR